MSDPPRVSVLLTTFEHERYVGEAIASVLEQTGVSFELIVGDDASGDGTRGVIERMAEAHPRIMRPILRDDNCGGARLFEQMIAASTGELIAYLDGDDYWTDPRKLERQVAYMDAHPECSMCFHDVWKVYEDSDQPAVRYFTPPPPGGEPVRVTVEQMFEANFVPSCAPVTRRAVLDPLPDWYFDLPWGDWPLPLLALRHGELVFLDLNMGVYRIHERGSYNGQDALGRARDGVRFFGGLRAFTRPEEEPLRRRALSNYGTELAEALERDGDRRAARQAIIASVRARPLETWRDPRKDRRRAKLLFTLIAPTRRR